MFFNRLRTCAIFFRASILLFTIVAITLSSCRFNLTHSDERADMVKAQQVADSLYLFIGKQEFKATDRLFSKQFFNASISSKRILEAHQALGKYAGKLLRDQKIRRVTGTNSLTEYELVYEINYQKHKAKERLILTREGTGIKITGYEIQSEGLLTTN